MLGREGAVLEDCQTNPEPSAGAIWGSHERRVDVTRVRILGRRQVLTLGPGVHLEGPHFQKSIDELQGSQEKSWPRFT